MTLAVGVDLDGVGHMFERGAAAAFIQQGYDHPELHRLVTGQAEVWEWYEACDMTLDQFLTACHRAADAGQLFTGHVWDGFVDALERMRAAGCLVHLKTDRAFGAKPSVSEDLTRAWLTELGVGYDSLTFTRDKTAGPPCDVFIEDKPSNYDALCAAGVDCYLVTRPWNRSHPVPESRRVASIGEFADRVLAKVRLQ